jgi:SAM-dependent methyltransferase
MPVPDLTRRADLDAVPELMDGPCSYEELRDCLRSLARFNRLSRAYGPTLDFLARAMATLAPSERPIRILDLGSGYGDTLRQIERWAAARRLPVDLLGVDLNPNAIRAAREATPPASRIRYLAGDATTLPELQSAPQGSGSGSDPEHGYAPDLIVCSLVMHHIPDAGIVRLLRWMDSTARVGWFVSDIHRMPVPYRLFSVLMRGPWWHPFIRPDGLASIRRAFRTEDWQRLTAVAGLSPAVITLRSQKPARLTLEHLVPPT